MKAQMRSVAKTYEAKIFIGGDYEKAKDVCREFCNEHPLCVTVTPTEYVYVGGAQSGVIVGLIQYPRFVDKEPNILQKAEKLGSELCDKLYQKSYTIVDTYQTRYYDKEIKSY